MQKCSKNPTMLYFVIAVIVYAIFPAMHVSAQQDSSPYFMNGSWAGKGYQDNGSQWTIALVVDTQNNSYNINYPSLSCGGNWTLKSSDGKKAWFNETITYGRNNCLNGTVVLTQINDEYITYTWFYLDGKLGASATLKKEK